MQIKDLQVKQGNVDIEVDVIDVSEPREFQKFGRTGKVATAIVKDETGDCKLSLWNEDVDKVKAGDRIKVTNGYVSEWQGEKQLTSGRMGKIEKIRDSDKEAKQEVEIDKREVETGETEKSGEEPVTEEEEIENNEEEW